MLKSKSLFSSTINDYKLSSGKDVQFTVYGVFDTSTVHWEYYLISHIGNIMTPDITGVSIDNITIDSIKRWGKSFKTKEEAISYFKEFKDKWEFGSNDTRQENRDKKISDILGDGSGA